MAGPADAALNFDAVARSSVVIRARRPKASRYHKEAQPGDSKSLGVLAGPIGGLHLFRYFWLLRQSILQ